MKNNYTRYLTASEYAHLGAFLMFNSNQFKQLHDENPNSVYHENVYITNEALQFLFHPSNRCKIKITLEGEIDNEMKETLIFFESYLHDLEKKLLKETK